MHRCAVSAFDSLGVLLVLNTRRHVHHNSSFGVLKINTLSELLSEHSLGGIPHVHLEQSYEVYAPDITTKLSLLNSWTGANC